MVGLCASSLGAGVGEEAGAETAAPPALVGGDGGGAFFASTGGAEAGTEDSSPPELVPEGAAVATAVALGVDCNNLTSCGGSPGTGAFYQALMQLLRLS